MENTTNETSEEVSPFCDSPFSKLEWREEYKKLKNLMTLALNKISASLILPIFIDEINEININQILILRTGRETNLLSEAIKQRAFQFIAYLLEKGAKLKIEKVEDTKALVASLKPLVTSLKGSKTSLKPYEGDYSIADRIIEKSLDKKNIPITLDSFSAVRTLLDDGCFESVYTHHTSRCEQW